MSDERTPTTEEVAANVAKAQAEAAKALAEAEKFRAEAAEAQAKADLAALKTQKEIDADIASRAGDEYHHVYRFDGAVDAASVSKCMKKLTEWHRLDEGCAIEVIFSSPGGSVIDGMELFDFLVGLQHEGHSVTTGCTGMAASMAGILVQAGGTRWMSHQSWYMIHRAAFGSHGKTFEVEDTVEWIKRIESRIIDIFTRNSHLTKNKIKRNWDRKDWWITADEALEMGLIDEIRSMPVQ